MKLGLRRRKLARRYGHAATLRNRKYNVYLHGKWLDRVFHSSPWPNQREREADVKRSLVEHDDYDPGIKVVEAR